MGETPTIFLCYGSPKNPRLIKLGSLFLECKRSSKVFSVESPKLDRIMRITQDIHKAWM